MAWNMVVEHKAVPVTIEFVTGEQEKMMWELCAILCENINIIDRCKHDKTIDVLVFDYEIDQLAIMQSFAGFQTIDGKEYVVSLIARPYESKREAMKDWIDHCHKYGDLSKEKS